ncbi:GNAT family N-acetyltransferase [Heyndrickxia acidicola]|uniref:GNAT family N-acetyltransferase n=1 Tax=Heyndrickxia acidicola TaxID=209389 RepID=UPI000826B7C2
MVSTASTQAEKNNIAILVGVATPPQYRGKGFATRVVAKLCNDVINDGKVIYLFYNNPTAGSIYKKIGFQEVGEWMVMGFKV